MAGNTVALEFAGDATKLQRAAQQATQATEQVGVAAESAGAGMDGAAAQARSFEERIGSLGAGVTGMTDAIDSAGAAVQGLADFQDAGRQHAQRLARAQADVEQAMIDGEQAAVDYEQAIQDLNQSELDGRQASIDYGQAQIDQKQALLDAKTAQDEYNKAVKEHGPNSDEAKQASIDLSQAQSDLRQATLDADQALADEEQANIDATQAVTDKKQATVDAKTAQLDLNDAMKEANPSGLQQWADKIALITPLLSAVVGVVGLVTAAQWAWNAAQLASPTTWIIAGIIALVGVVVLLVKHWDKVKAAGAAAWNWIKNAASNSWNFIKKIPGWLGSAFSGIARTISAPYRAAFNFIADAWNNTIGSLSWTVPGWVPVIGGNTISVPNLPKFHQGGTVPGAPGSEMLAILQAGETVTPAGGGGDTVHVTVVLNREVLINAMAKGVRRRGGNVQFVLGGVNA